MAKTVKRIKFGDLLGDLLPKSVTDIFDDPDIMIGGPMMASGGGRKLLGSLENVGAKELLRQSGKSTVKKGGGISNLTSGSGAKQIAMKENTK